jgi:hypothetical protein
MTTSASQQDLKSINEYKLCHKNHNEDSKSPIQSIQK